MILLVLIELRCGTGPLGQTIITPFRSPSLEYGKRGAVVLPPTGPPQRGPAAQTTAASAVLFRVKLKLPKVPLRTSRGIPSGVPVRTCRRGDEWRPAKVPRIRNWMRTSGKKSERITTLKGRRTSAAGVRRRPFRGGVGVCRPRSNAERAHARFSSSHTHTRARSSAVLLCSASFVPRGLH